MSQSSADYLGILPASSRESIEPASPENEADYLGVLPSNSEASEPVASRLPENDAVRPQAENNTVDDQQPPVRPRTHLQASAHIASEPPPVAPRPSSTIRSAAVKPSAAGQTVTSGTSSQADADSTVRQREASSHDDSPYMTVLGDNENQRAGRRRRDADGSQKSR